VERDTKEAKHYWEFAAMEGCVAARYNLGLEESRAGNNDRAAKHWMMAAGAGDDDSLKGIRQCFMKGHATKDDFEKALRAYKEASDEMKSDQRDKAAAALAARGRN
jgi:TPR repeat protein